MSSEIPNRPCPWDGAVAKLLWQIEDLSAALEAAQAGEAEALARCACLLDRAAARAAQRDELVRWVERQRGEWLSRDELVGEMLAKLREMGVPT